MRRLTASHTPSVANVSWAAIGELRPMNSMDSYVQDFFLDKAISTLQDNETRTVLPPRGCCHNVEQRVAEAARVLDNPLAR